MIIGAYAMGATAGFIYARAEYPLAIARLKKAITDAKSMVFWERTYSAQTSLLTFL